MDTSHVPGKVIEPDFQARYTLEMVVKQTGLTRQTILHYCEQGLVVSPDASADAEPEFDERALQILRQIDHLQSETGMNMAGVRLVLGLLEEVEHLQAAIRGRR